MAGWIAAISRRNVVPLLLRGLRQMDYAAGESARISVSDGRGFRSCCGTNGALARACETAGLSGGLGIAQVGLGLDLPGDAPPADIVVAISAGAWGAARRGRGDVTLRKLAAELLAHGAAAAAAQRAGRELPGSWTLAAASAATPDRLLVLRGDGPLAVGVGEGEQFAASNLDALLPETHRVIFPEEGDAALLKCDDIGFVDAFGKTVVRAAVNLQTRGEFAPPLPGALARAASRP
ncbi:MAG TPA: hypothetical protein VM369_05390 [Candidatus Binatia bacterium]|nr:hypothetical protein [Candidatus Binatia bacterium]